MKTMIYATKMNFNGSNVETQAYMEMLDNTDVRIIMPLTKETFDMCTITFKLDVTIMYDEWFGDRLVIKTEIPAEIIHDIWVK